MDSYELAAAYKPNLEPRERGTIVSWSTARPPQLLGEIGRIRADNGDSVVLFYWSVLRGFRQFTVGQRVEFSRMWFGPQRNAATLAVPIPTDAESN